MGPHGRKINTCAKGGIGCRRSRSRRGRAGDEEKKTEKRKEEKKRKKERQKRAIVRAERLTTHRNHVSVEQRDQGEAARCVCAQSSSLADISTLTRMSPSTRTQAGPHGLLPNPQLIYSAIGPSEGCICVSTERLDQLDSTDSTCDGRKQLAANHAAGCPRWQRRQASAAPRARGAPAEAPRQRCTAPPGGHCHRPKRSE